MRQLFLALLAFSAGCSSIETQWFLKADEPYAAPVTGEIEGLAYSSDQLKIEIWATSGRYRTMYGPPLMPFIPDEPPILNDEQIHLSLRLTLGDATPLAGRIIIKNLAIQTGQASIKPDLATSYLINAGQRGKIVATYGRDDMPEFIDFAAGIELQLTYFSARFSEVGSFAVAPEISIRGHAASLPRFQLTPQRDRNYRPWVFPFSYGGVR